MKKTNKGFLFGLIAVLAAVALIAGYTILKKSNDNRVADEKASQIPISDVHGYLGGEKIDLFEDPEFKKIAENKYHLRVDYAKNGSIDMVSGDAPDGQDYLFPSSQTALDIYKAEGKYKAKSTDIIFNTPIVIYSWKPVVEELMKNGYVTDNNGVYNIDMVKLSQAMKENKQWGDVGLGQLYGSINVATTDPNASNSGNMFLGLMANSLNNGQPVSKDSLPAIQEDLKNIYQRSGYMNTSSSDMFQQFLSQGMGAFPMVAGYENQLLEFSKSNPDVYSQIKDNVVMLYPTPTVWSSHVFIAQKDNAVPLDKMLKDPAIQNLAWSKHGFRTAVSGTVNTKDFAVAGLSQNITNVMPLPSSDIMLELMRTVKNE